MLFAIVSGDRSGLERALQDGRAEEYEADRTGMAFLIEIGSAKML